MKSKLLLLFLAFFSTSMYAQSSWRLMGPAASYHSTLDGAYIKNPASGEMRCQSGATNCSGHDIPAKIGWNQFNPAIGIEYSEKTPEHRDFAFATAVIDSYDKWGVMGGIGRTWPIAQLGSVQFELGLTGGLWWRSVADGVKVGGKMQYCFRNDPKYGNSCIESGRDYYVTDLKQQVVPFVLPLLSITEKSSGIGLNVAVAPKMRIGDLCVPTTTVMIQTTFRF